MSWQTQALGYGGWALVLLFIGAILGALLIQHWDSVNWERQLAGELERDRVLAEGRAMQAAEPITCDQCTPLNGLVHLCNKGHDAELRLASAAMSEKFGGSW